MSKQIILYGFIFWCFAGLFLHSCNEVCSDVFKMEGITVLTPGQERVFLDSLRITETRTGNIIDLCKYDGQDPCPDGSYMEVSGEGIQPIIFHDGLREKIGLGGMGILVEGYADSLAFRQIFLIGDDGCLAFKIAGPDTVHLQPMTDR